MKDEIKVKKGSAYYRKKFFDIFKEFFPDLEVAYRESVCAADSVYLPEDYIEHLFDEVQTEERPFLRFFRRKVKVLRPAILIEPNTREYPRREIWDNDRLRPIRLEVYLKEYLERAKKFAKKYREVTGLPCTVVQEFA